MRVASQTFTNKEEERETLETIWLEYAWTLLVLIGLEGLLSADNALVLAVIAKHLPENEKRRAINYGIILAFVFRFLALFAISFIANVWQIQAIGALYLLYLGFRHIYKNHFSKESVREDTAKEARGMGFWPTVGKIAIADVAFAIDSILAAVALALALPDSPFGNFGGMDAAKFAVVVLGGLAGLILIKFAATWFVTLLDKRPALETTAYVIVAWVGVKLAIITLAHEDINILPADFPHSTLWTITFYAILVGIALFGWFSPANKKKESKVSST